MLGNCLIRDKLLCDKKTVFRHKWSRFVDNFYRLDSLCEGFEIVHSLFVNINFFSSIFDVLSTTVYSLAVILNNTP